MGGIAMPTPIEDAHPIKAMAVELATKLDALFNAFMEGLDGEPESDRSRNTLRTFLWENKISLLRICEYVAGGEEVKKP